MEKSNKVKVVISVAITVLFLVLNLTIFKDIWIRIYESIIDLYNSVVFYICFVFDIPCDNSIMTVNSLSMVPFKPIFKFPSEFSVFKEYWHKYWILVVSADNINNFYNTIIEFLSNFSKILMLVIVPLGIVVFMLFRHYFETKNNDYNKDSKQLKFYKKYIEKNIIFIKFIVLEYVYFLLKDKRFIKIWIIIWLLNFNFITILIEFFAYYMYFSVSFDIIHIYLQVIKLLSDLSVMVSFVPGWCWIIVGYCIFDIIRKNIGYDILRHLERRNCGFINERPLVIMLVGTMGKRKTTIVSDISLSKGVLLKQKALAIISDCDGRFPNFPWILFENEIKRLLKEHKIYNIAGCRKYIDDLETLFVRYLNRRDDEEYKDIVKELKEKCYYNHKDMLWGYDYISYGLYYDNALHIQSIFEVLSTYIQVYFIYVMNTSNIISNYSIRTDMIKLDENNFPMFNYDFFKRPSRGLDKISKYAHIIDFDALRLGKRFDEENINKDSFDFGVVCITEVGKERKNQLELQSVKKNDETVNQKNDGFIDWLKMIRHFATIDCFPFVMVITDEQRPESLGADARDLCDICTILEAGDWDITLPFFGITELVHNIIYEKFKSLYYKYRFNRSDNTLFMYLFKQFVYSFHRYYVRQHNTFNYCTNKLLVEEGTQREKGKIKKYYLMSKKIYSKRFSTDCFADIFSEKQIKSKVGIEDLASYSNVKATFEELDKQHSYFVESLKNIKK